MTRSSAKKDGKRFEILNNDDKISNSSTPMVNEKLASQQEQKMNKNKIELDFEVTEEEKIKEESMNFGSSAPMSLSLPRADSNLPASAGIGHGLNSL